MLPGERDLALGLPLLRRLAKQHHLPLLASNLYGRDGKRLFDADKLVDAAGTKIGVFGVTAPPVARGRRGVRAAGIDARDPVGGGARRGSQPARRAPGSSWRWSTSATPAPTASW